MTAKEMFEALDYKIIENNERIITYMMYIGDDMKKCSFYLIEKMYKVWIDSWETYAENINTDLHEAITQQMKELGWIK